MSRGKLDGFNQRIVPEFDEKKGRGVGPWGDNVLLLTARGARTGELITTGTVYRRHGDDHVIVGSKGGAPEDPKWYRNLLVSARVVEALESMRLKYPRRKVGRKGAGES